MAGFFSYQLVSLARLALFVFLLLVLLDGVLLFRSRNALFAARQISPRLSNGDDNPVEITVENRFPFQVSVSVIDELPARFQVRDKSFELRLAAHSSKTIRYFLRPVQRGEYGFGGVNLYAASRLGLVQRRFRCEGETTVAVYPSYLQMRRYEFFAISNQLEQAGIKRLRRIGHTLEFEHIRNYVIGDDYRAVNWKASARTGRIMVNQFQDEKSQQVYNLIDMGRVMKMPFDGMTLLDYAINASLTLSNIAIRKQDRAGILTFSDRINMVIPAERRSTQIHNILEGLYRQETAFLESDFEALYATVRNKIRQRSLLLLYTNFETLNAMERQVSYLRRLARSHLLTIIFFENTELRKLLHTSCKTAEEVYIKTIAEKFALEKRQIVKELASHGIHAILTTPKDLTVNTINKYLEFKTRGLI